MQIKKIYIRLAGGLGNQLFQLTAAQNIGLQCDSFPKIYALSDGLNTYASQRDLGNEIHEICFPEIILDSGASVLMRAVSHLRIPKLWELDALGFCAISSNLTVKSIMDSQRELKTILLDGYFQDVEILKRSAHLRSRMYESLTGRYADCVSVSSARASVGIHIRRGDYLGTEFVMLPLEYYQRAAGMLPSCDFYVFGDDPGFVKEVANLVSGHAVTADHRRPHADFIRFMSCDHHIIANSTFSLYASFLASHKGGRVIFPRSWYQNRSNPFAALADWDQNFIGL